VNAPIIAPEGYPHIAVTVFLAGLAHWLAGPWWAIPFYLVVIFVLQFFRDPPRRIPSEPLGVVSPADGKVVFVGPAEDPYLHRPSVKISVFMNVFDVHSNRSPVEGKVTNRWYQAGRFLNAVLDKASAENERNALWIRTDEGDDVVCVQVAGLVARRILCYVNAGDRVGQGQRYGFIRFGSRLDVYLPPGVRVHATLGTRVSAGSDIIAHLVH
jgi:phosphatidylserine decarboxylase